MTFAVATTAVLVVAVVTAAVAVADVVASAAIAVAVTTAAALCRPRQHRYDRRVIVAVANVFVSSSPLLLPNGRNKRKTDCEQSRLSTR